MGNAGKKLPPWRHPAGRAIGSPDIRIEPLRQFLHTARVEEATINGGDTQREQRELIFLRGKCVDCKPIYRAQRRFACKWRRPQTKGGRIHALPGNRTDHPRAHAEQIMQESRA